MSQSVQRLLAIVLLTCASAGAEESTLTARVQITGEKAAQSSRMQNVVVWLSPVDSHASVAPFPPRRLRLTQHHKGFEPHLLIVPVGAVVEFPNRDPFFHNVFSLFEGKRFDLGLYEAGTTRDVSFDRPGVSYIFCNIHAEMSAVVIALATPYYAISNTRGELTLPNVPPGRYELQIFHSSVPPDALRAVNREITVTADDKYGRDYDRPEPDSPAYARP